LVLTLTIYHKLISIAACFLFVLVTDVTVRAASKSVAIYLGAGPSVAVSPAAFRNDHKTGFHILTGLGYTLNPNAELVGRLELHLVPIDFEERFGSDVDLNGGTLDLLVIGADMKLCTHRVAAPIRPFVLAGGGWSLISQSSISSELAFEQYAPLLMDNQSRFYFNIGVGADLKPTSTLTLFLLARYVELRRDGDSIGFVPLTLGIKF
jgi:hypothetical protein